MLRIGIFGGTFSPPHNGHLYIAREALNRAKLDKVVFVPCGNPYHKSIPQKIDVMHRFEMTRLAISDEPEFEISDVEVEITGPSYTAETLKKLKLLYPDGRLCLLVGGDSFLDMTGWYKPDEIFKTAEIIVANRGGVDSERIDKAVEDYKKIYNANITVIDITPVEISATDIRERLKMGSDLSGIVPDKVLDYINETGIYRESF